MAKAFTAPEQPSSDGVLTHDTSGDTNLHESYLASSRATSSRRSRKSISAKAELLLPALANSLTKHTYNFVVSDPRQPDHPIVYVSEGFYQLTGFSPEEVLGRNCRFLQGPDTDRQTVMEIRDAIREERSCQVKILNYTKSGQPFWNLFHLAPVFSREDGRVLHFVGVQTLIAGEGGGGEGCLSEDLQREADGVLAAANSGVEGSWARRTSGNFPGDVRGNGEGGMGEAEAVPGGSRSEEIGEGEPEVDAELKSRATTAVGAVLADLTSTPALSLCCHRLKGMDLASSAAKGVVCSSLVLALARIQQSFVLADPHLPDCPIVHASDVFLQLTGYNRDEIVGRNCRFLQGPNTDPAAVKEIRAAVSAERPCSVRILNYRKCGTPFWNSLHVAPIRRSDGQVAFFCGVQLDIEQATEAEGRGGGGAAGAQKGGLSFRLQQLGAVGAIRVAVRGLQGSGLRRRVGG